MEWLGYISMKIIVFYTNVGKVKNRETLPPCGPEGKELHAILGGRALQPHSSVSLASSFLGPAWGNFCTFPSFRFQIISHLHDLTN